MILFSLILTLAMPSFSQNNTGGGGFILRIDGIPDDDQSSSSSSSPDSKTETAAGVTDPKKKISKVERLKKDLSLMKINHLTKKLIKSINSNITEHCHEDEAKIKGLKTLVQYLNKKEMSEMVKLATQKSQKNCQKSAFSCVFKAEALASLSKLIHDPYFFDYLVENKKWKESSASDVITYLTNIEKALKSK